jgi:hypothetical protein
MVCPRVLRCALWWWLLGAMICSVMASDGALIWPHGSALTCSDNPAHAVTHAFTRAVTDAVTHAVTQIETARLYKVAGVNPLAGCLPTIATIPVFIGLYKALSNAADEGLGKEPFFWIPDLSGPTTLADRAAGSGMSWLFPLVDGAPPIGCVPALSHGWTAPTTAQS